MTVRQWFLPQTTSLVSPFFDVMMAGGLAIILFLVFQIAIDRNVDIFAWSIALYYAAFLVNFPHFAASYQLLYHDARHSFLNFRNEPRFAMKLWWAGLVVPIILIGYFLWALSEGSMLLMGYLVNALYFFVGWHYIKQIYGCMIVFSSAKKIYFDVVERATILLPLYAIWALSYINVNTYAVSNVFYSIPFTSLSLPVWLVEATEIILFVTTLGFITMLILRRMLKKPLPPLAAMVAFISIYLWYIPLLYHPAYFYIIPLFHSLQYLLFVVAHRRNVALRAAPSAETSSQRSLTTQLTWLGVGLFLFMPLFLISLIFFGNYRTTVEQLFWSWGNAAWVHPTALLTLTLILLGGVGILWLKKRWRQQSIGEFLNFFFWAYLLGAVFFIFAPNFLDMLTRQELLPKIFAYDTSIFGFSLYLFFFTVFINIHHYFIDNVIWKRDNPSIRGALFLRPEEVDTLTK